MMKGKRGFAVTMVVVWLAGILTLGAASILVGPKIIQAVRGNNQNVAKQQHKVQESYPVLYVASIDKEGRATYKPAGQYKKSEEFYNLNREQPPETWMQKFFGLGAYAILICVLVGGGITAAGAWPLVRAIRKRWMAKLNAKAEELDTSLQDHAILHAEAKQIVESVDSGWGVIKQTIELNRQLANAATDPNQKAIFQAKADVLDQAIKDMKKEMDRIQDTETYNRVQELMIND